MTPRPRLVGLPLAALLLAAGCGGSEEAASPPTNEPLSPETSTSSPAPTAERGEVDVADPQVVASGLEVPWDVAFLPDGDALVTERDSRRLLRLPAAGGEPQVAAVLEEAQPRGEGGLLGLALSPDYEQDGLVFVYLTTADENRIVRFTLPPDGGEADAEPVLTGIPSDRVHNGGRIAFGPDGALYAGTGDAGNPGLAQDDSSLGGKVLRMTPDGDPVDGAESVVLSKGHRNVQGLGFDDAGRLYAVEFGANRFDEVNLVTDGFNGGWPEVEGPGTGGGRFDEPLVTWSTAEASPSGAAVLGDDLWVAALRGERLWRVPLDGAGGAGTPEPALTGEFGRLRHAAVAPDGSLWVLTSNRDGRGAPVGADDRILRLPAR